ncbi:hypothetical protein GCM10023172_24230 [Hymenobacter ginsengisoli]|uniref:Uncharacterized protein n=1 Tax=Hymenobacter ginsengisoli TaxID=1051626 RepID=A0ABP8QE97_9BACT|nr:MULTISPECIES: hypothetical protein [unclassified Hymenobacter]MBO2033184.1 hypothetical protein [Hymenobacter sp. BT559]
MRPELERLQHIEEQLLRGPAAQPAAEWQLQLLLDPELQADAEAQQQLYAGLRAAGRRQLRSELAGIHTRLYGPPPEAWPHRVASWLRGAFGRN